MLSVLLSSLLTDGAHSTAIALVLIVVFGIPHGATDHVLFNVLNGRPSYHHPRLAFLARYLVTILMYGIVWWLLPTWALLVFLFVSAYHFGEAQLGYLGRSPWVLAASMTWGALVLAIVLFTHASEVKSLLVPYLVEERIWLIIAQNSLLIALGLFGAFSGILAYVRSQALSKELPELAMIFVLSWNTTLLLSFALFFVFWHSVDAVKAQLRGLKEVEIGFDLRKWAKLSAPFTIISILGIGLAIVGTVFFEMPMPQLTVFFILIALITLPHAIVMSWFYQS